VVCQTLVAVRGGLAELAELRGAGLYLVVAARAAQYQDACIIVIPEHKGRDYITQRVGTRKPTRSLRAKGHFGTTLLNVLSTAFGFVPSMR
jgi:hypothetical protein